MTELDEKPVRSEARERGSGNKPAGYADAETHISGTGGTRSVGTLAVRPGQSASKHRSITDPSTNRAVYWLLLASACLGMCISIPSSIAARQIQIRLGFGTHWTLVFATLAQAPFAFKFAMGYVVDTMPLGGYAIKGHAYASALGAVASSTVMLMAVEGARRIDSNVSFFDLSLVIIFCYVFFAACSAVVDACVLEATSTDNIYVSKLRKAFEINSPDAQAVSAKVMCGFSAHSSRSGIPASTWLARDSGAFVGFLLCSAWRFESHPAPVAFCLVSSLLYSVAIYNHLRRENKVVDMVALRTGIFRKKLFFDYFQNPSLGIVPVLVMYTVLCCVPSASTVIDYMVGNVDRGLGFRFGMARTGKIFEYLGQLVGVIFYIIMVIPVRNASGKKKKEGEGEGEGEGGSRANGHAHVTELDHEHDHEHEAHPQDGDDVRTPSANVMDHVDGVSSLWPRPVHQEMMWCSFLHVVCMCFLIVVGSKIDGSLADEQEEWLIVAAMFGLILYGFAARLLSMPFYDYCFQITASRGVRNTASGIVSSVTNVAVLVSMVSGDTIAAAMGIRDNPKLVSAYFGIVIAFDFVLFVGSALSLMCERSRKNLSFQCRKAGDAADAEIDYAFGSDVEDEEGEGEGEEDDSGTFSGAGATLPSAEKLGVGDRVGDTTQPFSIEEDGDGDEDGRTGNGVGGRSDTV